MFAIHRIGHVLLRGNNKYIVYSTKPFPPSFIPHTQPTLSQKPLKTSSTESPPSYYRNTFISPVRAMNDYQLELKHLELLQPRMVRSAFSTDPAYEKCYLKSEVEQKALEVWGSFKKLELERTRRSRLMQDDEVRSKILAGLIGRMKKANTLSTMDEYRKRKHIFLGGSGRVVGFAVLSNLFVLTLKLSTYLYTGSSSLLSEAIHSFADLCNQILLAIGIALSTRDPSPDHPYGFATARYIYSLMSGMSVFFLGAGMSVYHGISSFYQAPEYTSLPSALLVLGASFVIESITLCMAVIQIREAARLSGVTFRDYILRGRDPSSVAVLLEDSVSVLGVLTAGTCLTLTYATGSHVYDAIGSVCIGGLLGAVALFLIKRNSDALMGRSIPPERLRHIIDLLERDRVIRSVHDVKALDLGADTIRFKAEINFDGNELARLHLDKQNMNSLLDKTRSIDSEDELYTFMISHGEQIIDTLAVEVDRLEKEIKKRFPEAKHVDLEVL
ncbi:Zinc transporter 9-like [Oopsacas minuta]|uniref:Proton-coupled zinc antiporter SLC30A9, mitochondrial n=1 Tax=Oopsacas minuta TaxID=111878 RepID=A0AAV7JLQ6_9METZ|nr:Zinc transporter 9-like [Oopsacas minuta]